MAALFTHDNTQYLRRSANLPARTAFTACCFYYHVSVQTDVDVIINLRNSASTQSLYFEVFLDGRFNIGSYNGGQTFTTTAAANNWYFCFMRGSDNTLSAGVLNLATGARETRSVSATNVFTSEILDFGNEQSSYAINGRIAGIKVWDVALSDDEIWQEAGVLTPIRTTNINIWCPLVNTGNDRVIDYSGNGRNLTQNSITADADGPPVAWGAPTLVFPTGETTNYLTYKPTSNITAQWELVTTPLLVNSDLMVRYLFNEASSGSSVTQINDSSGNNYHLTEINYNSGAMFWIQDTDIYANRGIRSSSSDSAQSIRRIISSSNDPFYDNRAGTKFTIEAVVRVRAASTNFGRITAVHKTGESLSQLGLGVTSQSNPLQFYVGWGSSDGSPTYNLSNNAGFPVYVVHVVVDTTQATNANRIKLFIDGVQQTAVNAPNITQNSNINITASTTQFWFLDRQDSSGDPSGARSVDSDIYYCAWYANAFTTAQITQNYDILATQNDSNGSTATFNYEGVSDTNEEPYDDYVLANVASKIDEYKFDFESGSVPKANSNLIINYNAYFVSNAKTYINVYQGSSLIKSEIATRAPGTNIEPTIGQINLSVAETASITDLSQLSIRITSA